jgi:hypothetical protein
MLPLLIAKNLVNYIYIKSYSRREIKIFLQPIFCFIYGLLCGIVFVYSPRIISMKTVLLTCFIICLTLGCTSTSGIRIDGEAYPYPDYYSDYPDYHDYWYGYYPDDSEYYDYYDYYYPYYSYYPYYPYYPFYRYHYLRDDLEDNNGKPLKGRWNQIRKRIEARRKAWRRIREERIKKIKQIRQTQIRLKSQRRARIRSILQRARPSNSFRVRPKFFGRRRR